MGHRGLAVWQRSMSLATEIYAVTRDFPRHEIFGLTSQLRRAAVSIPSNIAELETQIEIAASLGYLGEAERQRVTPLIAEVGRLLTAMIRGLRRRIAQRAPTPSAIR